MAFGGFNKKFSHETNGSNWLSRNPVNAQNYAKDPLCNFVFTVNAYYQMFCGIQAVNRQEKNGKVPKTLPIFLWQEKKIRLVTLERVWKTFIKITDHVE